MYRFHGRRIMQPEKDESEISDFAPDVPREYGKMRCIIEFLGTAYLQSVYINFWPKFKDV